MKTYRRIVLIIAGILGIIALLLMVSFSTLDACAFANKNSIVIKQQTQLAIEALDLKKAKHHAFKALGYMKKTKSNYERCGCKPALINIGQAEVNLTQATKTRSFDDSKTFLQIALKNTLTSMVALKEFDGDDSHYDDDVLVLNTKQLLEVQGGVILSRSKQLKETMDNSLLEFEASLQNIIQHVECTDAFNFISKIHGKTKEKFNSPSLSDAKKYYHGRLKEITYNALTTLEGCPVK